MNQSAAYVNDDDGLVCAKCYKPFNLLTDDAKRYQWLRNEFAHGRETYIGESIPSGESLDKYIDEQMSKS
jgi:hypothetical protein